METKMQLVQFWINERQYKEAIRILGDKSKFYAFAKKRFLEGLKNVHKD